MQCNEIRNKVKDSLSIFFISRNKHTRNCGSQCHINYEVEKFCRIRYFMGSYNILFSISSKPGICLVPFHASEPPPNHNMMNLERNFCYRQVIPYKYPLTMPSPLCETSFYLPQMTDPAFHFKRCPIRQAGIL